MMMKHHTPARERKVKSRHPCGDVAKAAMPSMTIRRRVSALTGLSLGYLSNVCQGTGRLSPDSAEKISRALRKLGVYVSARDLVFGRPKEPPAVAEQVDAIVPLLRSAVAEVLFELREMAVARNAKTLKAKGRSHQPSEY